LHFSLCGGHLFLKFLFAGSSEKRFFPVVALAALGSANLFFEPGIAAHIFEIPITAGFLSWASIILRAAFSISLVLLLVASTGISDLAAALFRLRVPREFVSTLVLLYRYLFVLSEEACSMNIARLSRSFGKRGFEITTASRMIGNLLLRSLARADRVHATMLARGFSQSSFGNHHFCWTRGDTIFLATSVFFFTIIRLVPVPEILGHIVKGVLAP
jgi:cobalt/nickel transport system permease protein